MMRVVLLCCGQMALQAQRLEAAQKEVSRASGAERQKEATARDLETQVAELQKEVQQFRAKLQDCNTKLKAATERADEGDRDAQQLADQVLVLEEQMEMERKTQSGTSSELQRQVKDLQDELRDKTVWEWKSSLPLLCRMRILFSTCGCHVLRWPVFSASARGKQ